MEAHQETAIPAIDSPNFKLAQTSDKESTDRILGINIQGVQRAYPIRILNWHEIINDSIGGQPIMITYCPLCGSGIAFKSEQSGFGVSGLLFNSDVLLYDRKTESLWSQIGMRAIAGERKGEELSSIPLIHTTLSQWLKMFPQSEILSTETGYKRDYSRSPYAGYENTPHTYFDVSNKAPSTFHPKSLVLGIRSGAKFKAYPYERLDKLNQNTIHDRINGKNVVINWDSQAEKRACKHLSIARLCPRNTNVLVCMVCLSPRYIIIRTKTIIDTFLTRVLFKPIY